MTPDEVVGPVGETPDLSDLAVVTLNAQTSDGKQYSMVWTAEEGHLSIEGPSSWIEGPSFHQWYFTIIQGEETS